MLEMLVVQSWRIVRFFALRSRKAYCHALRIACLASLYLLFLPHLNPFVCWRICILRLCAGTPRLTRAIEVYRCAIFLIAFISDGETSTNLRIRRRFLLVCLER